MKMNIRAIVLAGDINSYHTVMTSTERILVQRALSHWPWNAYARSHISPFASPLPAQCLASLYQLVFVLGDLIIH